VLPGAGCTCFGGNAEAGNADPRPKIATVWSAERRGVPIARKEAALRIFQNILVISNDYSYSWFAWKTQNAYR
jgi:hypothetical protein